MVEDCGVCQDFRCKKDCVSIPCKLSSHKRHIKNLKQFFNKIERHCFTFIWEPRGRWERDVVERLCMGLTITPCFDPFGGRSIRGDLLYVRLHGRTGYHYSYGVAEMEELIRMGKAYSQAYLLFNNTDMYEDALRLKNLLEKEESYI